MPKNREIARWLWNHPRTTLIGSLTSVVLVAATAPSGALPKNVEAAGASPAASAHPATTEAHPGLANHDPGAARMSCEFALRAAGTTYELGTVITAGQAAPGDTVDYAVTYRAGLSHGYAHHTDSGSFAQGETVTLPASEQNQHLASVSGKVGHTACNAATAGAP